MGLCAYIDIQSLWLDNVVVDHENLKTSLLYRQVLVELGELGSTNTIGAVDGQLSAPLLSFHCSLERCAELLVVTNFGRDAVRVRRAFCVTAPNHVV